MSTDHHHSTLDPDRLARQGFPEVVFCEGKTDGQIVDCLASLARSNGRSLGTRLDPARADAVLPFLPGARFDALSRTIAVGDPPPEPAPDAPAAAVVCAGTSDLPVAGEAAATLEFLGHPVRRIHDVGVAGVHRLDARFEEIRTAAVVIVVAGMEGALPSVIGGRVASPVVAVPTSVGYGASFRGLAALLGMLNSCAAGLAVVNIDNGFGAAMAAQRILQAIQTSQKP